MTNPLRTNIALCKTLSYLKLLELAMKAKSHFQFKLNITSGQFNDILFETQVLHAQVLIENRRQEYNQFRPYSSLDYRPFAKISRKVLGLN